MIVTCGVNNGVDPKLGKIANTWDKFVTFYDQLSVQFILTSNLNNPIFIDLQMHACFNV